MPQKLNIYIVGHYRVGAADGLAEFNYQNTTLLQKNFNFHFIEFDNSKSTLLQESKYIDGFEVLTFGSKGLNKFQLPISIINWFKSVDKVDTIFHLHHIYNLTNYLISRQLVKHKLPYLITPHDSFVYSLDYSKEKPFLKRIYRKVFVRIFDKYVLDHAKVVHGLTNQCSLFLKNITKSPVCVVLNQVNEMGIEFDPAKIKPQICFIGRFDILRKGIDLALESYQLFKNENSGRNEVSFVLIGPADEEAKDKCDAICKQLNLEIGKDVLFTGKLSVEERNRTLSESKVYMQLSRTEGFGLSIAQALSCFKPVIISNNVPIHDKIVAHQAGYAVSNPKEAAEALKAIFNLPEEEYLQMARNARKCYEHEFHPDVIKPQLIALYDEVILH